MKRIVISVILLVLIGAGAYFGWQRLYAPAESAQSPARPPATVSSATVEAASWPRSISAVATLSAVQRTEVAAEVPGIIEHIAFESGQRVREGDLLVRLDDDADRMRLRELEAELELARVTLARQQELAQQNFISEAALDDARSTLIQARARVAQQRVQLAKKRVRAPFGGLLGLRQVDVGTFVDAGAPIVELQTLDPIYADFSLPQQFIDEIAAEDKVRFTVDAHPGEAFEGQISAIDPSISEETRNFDLRATLPNPSMKLRPGMFGEAEVLRPGEREVLTLPDTAITYNPYGNSVFVIERREDEADAALVAKRVFVQTGEHRGTLVEITKGLGAGEQVVSTGQLKLRDGDPVRIDNERTPREALNPEIQQP